MAKKSFKLIGLEFISDDGSKSDSFYIGTFICSESFSNFTSHVKYTEENLPKNELYNYNFFINYLKYISEIKVTRKGSKVLIIRGYNGAGTFRILEEDLKNMTKHVGKLNDCTVIEFKDETRVIKFILDVTETEEKAECKVGPFRKAEFNETIREVIQQEIESSSKNLLEAFRSLLKNEEPNPLLLGKISDPENLKDFSCLKDFEILDVYQIPDLDFELIFELFKTYDFSSSRANPLDFDIETLVPDLMMIIQHNGNVSFTFVVNGECGTCVLSKSSVEKFKYLFLGV